MLKKSRTTRWRQGAAAASVVAASAAVTAGVTALGALPAEGRPQAVEPAVTRIGPLPEGAAVSRGDRPAGQVLDKVRERQQRRAAKAAREAHERGAAASRSASRTVSYDGDPRGIARAMAERYGWGAGEFSCLSSLWERESSWNVHAANPSSGAYGIPQAMPGSTMSTNGADWRDNPVTQIGWGLAYIRQSHSTPCGAWSAFQSEGWY